ncbi:MAG: PAS domain S-box protein [bacterium]
MEPLKSTRNSKKARGSTSARRGRSAGPFLENSSRSILIHRENRLVFANAAAARLFGYPAPGEILALTALDALILPEERERVGRYFQLRLDGGEGPAEIEFRALRRDGGEIWLYSQDEPILWEGRPAVHSIQLDFSGRRRAEEALRTKGRLLDDLMAHIPLGVGMTDADLSLVLSNDLFNQLIDLPEALGLPGTPIDKIFRFKAQRGEYGPGDVEGHVKQHMDQVRLSEPHHFHRRRPDGRMMEIRGNPLPEGGFITTYSDATARAQIEEALRESEAKFRTLVEQASDGIFISSPEGNYLDANRRGLELLRCTREELLTLKIRDFLPPDEKEGFQRRNKQLEERGAMLFERGFLRSDGTRFPAEISAKVMEDGNTLAIMRDISERKRGEKELRESEERFRNLIEGSAQGILVHREYQILFANQAAADLFGYDSPTELFELKNFGVFLAPGEIARFKEFEQRHGGENRPIQFEVEAIRKDGRRFFLHVQNHLVGWMGQPALQATFYDITERKKADEALRKSEENLRMAQQIASLGSWERDLANGTVTWSAEVFRIFGVDPGRYQVSTGALLQSVHPEDREKVRAATGAAIADGVPYDLEYRIRRPDGSIRILHGQGGVATRAANGKPLTLVGTVHDLTERRQMEEQLRQAQKMDAIGNLAGGIAHDLNNLLQPVVGFAELLLEDFGPESEAHNSLKLIRDSATRGKDLVSQILLFSHRQEGKKELCDLQTIVQQVLKLLRPSLAANIELRTQLPQGSLLTVADSTQIHRLLLNLCINGAQAMPEGGILEISSEIVQLEGVVGFFGGELTGSYLRLAVIDTGLGMDEETLSRIFEPFFTTKGVGAGTGLGLATAYGTLQQCGGEIAVTSKPGEGSTFALLLPAAGEELDWEEPTSAQAPEGTETILFVDDDESVAIVWREILARKGYRVDALTSSTEALALFKSDPQHFDLVITDETMPTMTGSALFRELKRIRPDIPVVLCTGFSNNATAESALGLGFDGFFHKPIRPAELGRIVRKVLDRSAPGQEAAL